MIGRKIILLAGILLTQFHYLHAQLKAVEVKDYAEGITTILPTAISNGNISVQDLILHIENFANSSNPMVQNRANRMLYQGSKQRPTNEEQSQAVVFFLNQLRKDTTNNRQSLIGYLMKYSSDLYNLEAKEILSEIIYADSLLYYDSVLKLAGFVGEGEKKMKQLSREENSAYKVAAKTALARLGDEKTLKVLLKNVVEVPVNDAFIYQTAPLLVYVRQKETTDYLFDLILSDEKNCTSPNPDSNTKMTCAYRLTEMIAPFIEEFPVKVGTSGDLETDDYPIALAKVRQWITEHKGDYKLKRNIF